MKRFYQILKIGILPLFALMSSCVVVYQHKPVNKTSDQKEAKEYGYADEYDPTVIQPAEYAIVQPNQQPEQLYPTPDNWEFYSQKTGTGALLRSNADSVGKMFRPDIAALDTTDLNRFIQHSDTVFYKNFYGDSIQISGSTGENIGNSNLFIPPDVFRSLALDTFTTFSINYPNSLDALSIFGGADSMALSGNIQLVTGNGKSYAKFGVGGFENQTALIAGDVVKIGDLDELENGVGIEIESVNQILKLGNIYGDDDTYIEIDFSNDATVIRDAGEVAMGDVFGDVSGMGIGIEGPAERITMGDIYASNSVYIRTDLLESEIQAFAPRVRLGDFTGSGNGWVIEVDDNSESIILGNIENVSNNYILLDAATGTNLIRPDNKTLKISDESELNSIVHTTDYFEVITQSSFSQAEAQIVEYTETPGDEYVKIRVSTVGSNTDIMFLQDSIGTTVSHLRGNLATPPSITVESAAGSGATASIVSAQSSDLAGRFSITTGTGAADGLWATIQFEEGFAVTPIVQVYNEGQNSLLLLHGVAVSTTGFEFFVDGADIADATTYEFNYVVIGGK